MGTGISLENGILLFDSFDQGSKDLLTSFRLAGYDSPAVVIEDDGFLPDEVQSVYEFFLGDFKKSTLGKGRPLYFNEIQIPDYWQISASTTSGKVRDYSKERARIYFAQPVHKRLVRVVDWLDEKGIVRYSDHYNKYGAIFCRTIFNAKGHKVNRSFFSATGQEVIVENFVTGDIILQDEGRMYIFHTKTDFVLHFLVRAQFKQSRLFINSLSTPFFVSQRMRATSKNDVLFWQEPIADSIPGNMQIILRGEATRIEHILVQKRDSYNKLVALSQNNPMLSKCGFIYPFERENAGGNEVLICTNSDRIEQLEYLIRSLPQMHFHIAALTEMSSRLMKMEEYANVTNYPNVKHSILEELFGKCDFYFDINYENEIVSAVRRAFLNNALIFGFEETVHNRDYVALEHLFHASNATDFLAAVQAALSDSEKREAELELQRAAALTEKSQDWKV